MENKNINESNEKDENIIESSKSISKTSFPMDINILKAPLFLFNNYKKPPMILDSEGKPIETVEEKTFVWVDSRGIDRKLKMKTIGRLPRQFESDTFYGLIGLFVKKHAPFPYNHETKQYEINLNKLEFSWYELCDFMKISTAGSMIKRLKEAVRILKQTQYYSYENGVIYDKGNGKYLISGEEGISLINRYKFKSNKKVAENDEYSTDIDNNYVVFDELILNNLRYEYLKYLDREMFFSILPSGITRGIYSYLEANRFDRNYEPLKYIKRSYESLRIGIPVDFKYPYEIKNKLKKPFENMMKIGYLRDFAYGDELKINGEPEPCVYFCFGITKQELKNMLSKKKYSQISLYENEFINEEISVTETNTEVEEDLKLPSKPLFEELINRKLDEKFAREIVSKKSKWDIIICIMWLDQRYKEGKINNMGAMLSFALRREEEADTLLDQYPNIYKFIQTRKNEEENNNKSEMDQLKEAYNKYIDENIHEFMNTIEYKEIKDVLLKDAINNVDRLINQNKLLGENVSKLEEFKVNGENSQYFKDLLIREIKIINKLMTETEFIEKYNHKSKQG